MPAIFSGPPSPELPPRPKSGPIGARKRSELRKPLPRVARVWSAEHPSSKIVMLAHAYSPLISGHFWPHHLNLPSPPPQLSTCPWPAEVVSICYKKWGTTAIQPVPHHGPGVVGEWHTSRARALRYWRLAWRARGRGRGIFSTTYVPSGPHTRSNLIPAYQVSVQ